MAKKTNNEDELFWAKLQGDWTNANYRRKVAEKGTCLETLIHDSNRAVCSEASRQLVDKLLKQITDGHV